MATRPNPCPEAERDRLRRVFSAYFMEQRDYLAAMKIDCPDEVTTRDELALMLFGDMADDVENIPDDLLDACLAALNAKGRSKEDAMREADKTIRDSVGDALTSGSATEYLKAVLDLYTETA
jgi:hypothetical protein